MAKEYAENSVEVPKTEQNLHTVQPCLCSCVCTCSTAVMTMSTAARVGVRMPAKAHASGNTSNVRITVCATRLDECETSLCSDSTVSQCAPREQHEQQPQHQQRGTLCRLYTAHTRTSSSVLIFLVLSFFACSPSSTYAFVSLTSSPTVAYRRYILNKRLPRFASSRGGGGGDGKDAGSYPHDRTLMLLKTPPPPCSPLQPLKLQQRNRHRLLLPALAAGASGGNDDSRDTCGTNAGAHTTMQKSSVAGGDDCGSVARVAIGQEAETRGGAEAAKQLQGIGGSSGGATQQKRRKRKEKDLVRVFTVAEMDELLAGGASLFDLDARGQSQKMLEGRQDEHPVLEVLRKRAAAGTVAGSHGDGLKVGLAIEGGGMRGCVSAGMIAAIYNLGLMDTFDAVYGSSAGSLVGAYAIAGQEGMPRLGCSVYYDTLTGMDRHFIDTRQLLRAMGLGLVGIAVTRWRGLKELAREKFGSPVLKLDYLLRDVVETQRPLDWDAFWKKQATQPLHVIASGVKTAKAVVLTSEGGNFKSLRELTECMRASMLLPGITGPMVSLPNVDERLVDSQLYEPIPFKTAVDDGCTHVLVIRSRPDGGNLLGKPKLPERLITRRFFKRKHKDPDSYKYMMQGGHKKLYAQSVLALNEAASATAQDSGPYLLPMCLPESEPEVKRLERRREYILEGVRKGYEHAHILLRRARSDHAMAPMGGREAALEAFPECILESDMDPLVREVLLRTRDKRQH